MIPVDPISVELTLDVPFDVRVTKERRGTAVVRVSLLGGAGVKDGVGEGVGGGDVGVVVVVVAGLGVIAWRNLRFLMSLLS